MKKIRGSIKASTIFVFIVLAAVTGILAVKYIAGVPEQPTKSRPAASPEQASAANPEANPLANLPHGRQAFRVMSQADRWPKVVEAIIDPPDVHLWAIQKLTLIVKSKEKVAKVYAEVETDKGMRDIPLYFQGEARPEDLSYIPYGLDSNGTLRHLGDPELASGGGPLIKKANAQEELPNLKYSGSWVVTDTHDKYYQTKFVALDVAGNQNDVTLAWSDACGIPATGVWSISAACSITSPDGVENGNANITTSTLTLTSDFAFNPGYQVNISGGTIAVSTNGRIVEGYVYNTDADNDKYRPTSYSTTVNSASSLAGYSRRSTIIGDNDCSDADISLYQNLTGYYDGDNDGYDNGGGSSQVCSGASLPSPYKASSSGTDCNDSNGYVQVNKNAYLDADSDNYTVSATPAVQCVSLSTCGDGQHSFDSSNACSVLTSARSGTDCYDSNANANPSSTYISGTNRGDGSFDYNCDGQETKFIGHQLGDCVAASAGTCTYNVTTNCNASSGISNQSQTDSACQNRTEGWRTDWTPTGCITPTSSGAIGCGQCAARWPAPGIGQVVTACYACNTWEQVTETCY